MRTVLDLSVNHFVQKHGDITCIGTWYGEGNRRPCLVLAPTAAFNRGQQFIPCIMPLDNAWMWAEETGDVRQCAASCYNFANLLGMDGTNQLTVMRVLSVIRDHIGDLLSMPLAPTHDLKVVADAHYKAENGKEIHKEIIDRE